MFLVIVNVVFDAVATYEWDALDDAIRMVDLSVGVCGGACAMWQTIAATVAMHETCKL